MLRQSARGLWVGASRGSQLKVKGRVARSGWLPARSKWGCAAWAVGNGLCWMSPPRCAQPDSAGYLMASACRFPTWATLKPRRG